MGVTELDIPCPWDGRLVGVLFKSDEPAPTQPTTKILFIHGWLDNLNSFLPLARRIRDRHKDFELCLFDRAGHGYSSHYPKGMIYSFENNLRDVRVVTRGIGWADDKFVIIGHSYGAALAMTYAAGYANEVICIVALDGQAQSELMPKPYWEMSAIYTDQNIDFYNTPEKPLTSELTFDKAVELIKLSRPGISDEAAETLTERSTHNDDKQALQFTHDNALNAKQVLPPTKDMVEDTIKYIQAPVLLIRAQKPQWYQSEYAIQLLKEHNPHLEMYFLNGPHHFHMTHVSRVADLIEQFFTKHLPASSSSIPNAANHTV